MVLWTLQHLQMSAHCVSSQPLEKSSVSFNSHIMLKLFIPVTVDKKNLSVHSTAAVSHSVHFYRCDVLCDIMWNGYKYWTCGGKDSSYNLSRRDWSLNVYPRIYNSCFIFYLLSFCALESYHPPLVSQYLLLQGRTLSVCLYLPSAPATMVNEILSNANCLSVLICLSVCLLLVQHENRSSDPLHTWHICC